MRLRLPRRLLRLRPALRLRLRPGLRLLPLERATVVSARKT